MTGLTHRSKFGAVFAWSGVQFTKKSLGFF
jgi:hypothetical protein